MVRKSLNTHGTLLVYLLCRLLTIGCFQKNRFGEIVNSGSQNNSKVQSTLSSFLSLLVLYSITHLTTFLLYHDRPYPIYHSPSLCIPSIRSQDIERKQSRNHGLPENSIPPYIVCSGISRPKRPTAEIALLAR